MRELQRVIIPEILDSLIPTDPRAMRSRRDLRLIDFYLGNSRWIVRQLQKQTPLPAQIIEIGAGEGILCQKIQKILPVLLVTGLDLAERPANLPSRIEWISGDFFQSLPSLEADTCVASLILHHFPDEALRNLGSLLQPFRTLIFSEPLRSRLPLFFSKLFSFLMGEVTRHDMPVSIRAGFRPRELPALLNLDSKRWIITESRHWRGALRLTAHRR